MNNATQKPQALGRGLSALLDNQAAAAVGGTAQDNLANNPFAQKPQKAADADKKLPVTALQPSKAQPRRHFAAEHINSLSESIAQYGVLQPLLVRLVDGGKYEIIGGERRWRAAKQAGLTEVPVIIRQIDDAKAQQIAIVENVQRADLNAIEEGLAYKRLQEEHSYTHEKIAELVGKSRVHVTNHMRLLNLPEALQSLVVQEKLAMGHARALVALNNDKQAQLAIAEKAMAEGLSTRAVEDMVHNALHGKDNALNTAATTSGAVAGSISPARAPTVQSAQHQAWQKSFENTFGMAATISGRKKLKVTLEFANAQAFEAYVQGFKQNR